LKLRLSKKRTEKKNNKVQPTVVLLSITNQLRYLMLKLAFKQKSNQTSGSWFLKDKAILTIYPTTKGVN